MDSNTKPPVYRLVDAATARELRRSSRTRARSKSHSESSDPNKSADDGAVVDESSLAGGASRGGGAKPKQVRFSLAIGDHDLSRRLERAREMLKEGHAVCHTYTISVL